MGGGGGGAEKRQTDSHTETDSQPARQTFRQKQRDGESLMKSAFPVFLFFCFLRSCVRLTQDTLLSSTSAVTCVFLAAENGRLHINPVTSVAISSGLVR